MKYFRGRSNRRGRRTRRRMRRPEMRPMEAYDIKNAPRHALRLKWWRKHPRFKRFSYGKSVRGFGRKGRRK